MSYYEFHRLFRVFHRPPLGTHLQIWQTKFHFSVQTTRSHQRWIQNVRPVGGHQHFDVASRIETVQLIDQLQHGTLHFVIATCSVVESRTADRIDLVEEYQARLLRSGHLEQFTNHTRTFADVLLHQL